MFGESMKEKSLISLVYLAVGGKQKFLSSTDLTGGGKKVAVSQQKDH